ncbi:putative myb/SANT-like domain-containing protein [Senna tora]|uniref:Putative myb/SANT-like domain-containing protein n=1 Tax=Senna tora TaxID=362788 RepID=A0A834XHG5_9FABA|nr:putative myb/SANT-like domain-containing protein [Senna tora]
MDQEADNVDNRSSKHNWSAEEDAALVACLVSMKHDQNHMQGSKFTSGHLGELEKMMQRKLPGCGLKGNPHIQSRIKTLKSNWTTVHDMVYGTNTSGFGWDEDRQMVVADKDVWDAYIKSHSDASRFRYKPFPHLIDLTKVWGKDRATGGDARDAEEINDQDDEDGIGLEGHNQTPPADGEQPSSDEMTQADCEAASTLRKRKRSSPNNDVIEGFKEITEPFLHRLDKIADGMNRVAREKDLDEKRLALCEALSQVDGLTDDELIRAHLRLAGDPALMDLLEIDMPKLCGCDFNTCAIFDEDFETLMVLVPEDSELQALCNCCFVPF